MPKHTPTLRPLSYPSQNPYHGPVGGTTNENDELGASLLTLGYPVENCRVVRKAWWDASCAGQRDMERHCKQNALRWPSNIYLCLAYASTDP